MLSLLFSENSRSKSRSVGHVGFSLFKSYLFSDMSTTLRIFTGILLSMFMLSSLFVIVRGLFGRR